MNLRLLAVLLLAVLQCSEVIRAENLDEGVRKCQDAIYRLEFDLAEQISQGLIQDHPNRPAPYALLAITRWNQLLQAAGNLALDDYATPTPFTGKPTKEVKAERSAFLEANERLLSVCDRLLEADRDDLQALYFKGVAFENLASEAIAISRESLEAWGYGRKASSFHSRVRRLDPGFVDAKLTDGVAEFARATLPWSIRWFTILVFPGNKESALKTIREVAEKGRFRRLDARVLLSLLEAWKGDPRESVRILDGLRKQYPANYLLDLNLAAIYQQNLDSPKEALKVYLELLDSLERKTAGLRPGEVYYRVALTYHRLHEYGRSLEALEKAMNSPKREKETESLCAFLMARIHEEQGDEEKARSWYRHMVNTAPRGDALSKYVKEARGKLN